MQDMQLINPSMRTSLIFVTAVLIFTACDDYDELNNLDKVDYKNYQYRGSFSIPLCNIAITLDSSGLDLPPGWQNAPSLLYLVDTFKFEKAIYFDFSKTMGDTDKIETIWFRVFANNDFPNELSFKIYFADSFKVIRESLSELEFKFEPATLNAYGKHIKHGFFYHEVKMERETIRKFGDIKFLILKEYIINDPSQKEYYQYYKFLQINIDLAFRVDLNFNVKNF
jgi:hypothetical protein